MLDFFESMPVAASESESEIKLSKSKQIVLMTSSSELLDKVLSERTGVSLHQPSAESVL